MYHPGDRIGPYQILFLERTTQYKNGAWKGRFICPYDGKEFESAIGSVASGATVSCGCKKRKNAIEQGHKNAIDLTAQIFGKIHCLRPTKDRNSCNNTVVWECYCECNPDRLIYIPSDYLTAGKVHSCGCIKSYGETIIKDILDSLNIIYKNNVSVGCINPKTKHCLYFDFYLPQYNCCIEYDGKQHFEYSSYCKDTLDERQYRDKIKNDYCKNQNIKLIRIPYTDLNKLSKEYILDLLNKE